jgi:hypothetical protein
MVFPDSLVWSQSWGFLNPKNKTIMQDLCTFWDEMVSGVNVGVPDGTSLNRLVQARASLYAVCTVFEPSSPVLA